jgi:hypothetical protein
LFSPYICNLKTSLDHEDVMNANDPFLETILPTILVKQLINKCSH